MVSGRVELRAPTPSQLLHWYVRSHATQGMKKEIQSTKLHDLSACWVLAAERANVRRILSLGEMPSSGLQGYTSRSLICVSDTGIAAQAAALRMDLLSEPAASSCCSIDRALCDRLSQFGHLNRPRVIQNSRLFRRNSVSMIPKDRGSATRGGEKCRTLRYVGVGKSVLCSTDRVTGCVVPQFENSRGNVPIRV